MKFVVIGAAVALTALLLPRTWRHVQLLRLTSQCLEYKVAPGTVVYQVAPGIDPHPLAKDPRYESLGTRVRGLVPRQWRALHQRAHQSPLKSYGTAFLGERRSKAARLERLMAMDVVQGSFHDSPLQLVWRLYDAGSVRSGPTALNVGVITLDRVQPVRLASNIRVYAGVPDPGDDAHFTIEVEVTGLRGESPRRYVIEGWVRENDVIVAVPDAEDDNVIFPQEEPRAQRRSAVAPTPPAPSSPASPPTSAAPATPPSAGPAGR